MTIQRVTFHQNYFGKKSTEIFETIIFPNTLFPTKKMQNQYKSIKNTVKYSDVSHSRFSIWFNFILFQEFRYYFSPLSRCFLHMEQIVATMNTFVLWPHWKINLKIFNFESGEISNSKSTFDDYTNFSSNISEFDLSLRISAHNLL